MAWTTSDLTVLEAAIASGTLRVSYSDKTVEYRSLEEMLKIRDLMRQELEVTSGRQTRIKSEYSNGL